MTRSESISDLAEALAQAQASMTGAAKDKTNPHFRSKYADLASIRDAAMPALNEHGLSVVQLTRTVRGMDGVAIAWSLEVETILFHKTGQFISEVLELPVPTVTAQTLGSAITYLRRYALAAITGVAPEDDDGEGATGRTVADNEGPYPTRHDARQSVDDRVAQASVPRPETNGGSNGTETHAEKVARIKREAEAKRTAPAPAKATAPQTPVPTPKTPPSAPPTVPQAPPQVPEPPATPVEVPAPAPAPRPTSDPPADGFAQVQAVNVRQGPQVIKDGQPVPAWLLYMVRFTRKVKADDGVSVIDASTLDPAVALLAEQANEQFENDPTGGWVKPIIVKSTTKKATYNLMGLERE